MSRGGVFFLSSVSFVDESSVYNNNSALLGGAISCTGCTMYTQGNTFKLNLANQGGAIYLESDANLTSEYDSFTSNTAIIYGGGIFATTRTILYILSSQFVSNYANSDSAISAYMTSTVYPFHIINSLFANNTAYSNTICLKNALGIITTSKFNYNKATVYTGNIFLSFSTLNISHTTFLDEQLGSPYELMKTTQIQGQFLFISLGVTLYVSTSTF